MALDLEALKAEFAARGGKATVVAQGTRAIASDKAIYAAMREGKLVAADSVVIARESEACYERQQDAHRAAIHSGWNREDAEEYARHAK